MTAIPFTSSEADLIASAIGAVTNEAFLDAILHANGSVQAVRDTVEASAYWPDFKELVAAGAVDPEDISSNPVLAECVLIWAAAT